MTTATRSKTVKPTLHKERSRSRNGLSHPAKKVSIQPKLSNGNITDKQGQEADSVADQVASLPAAPIAVQANGASHAQKTPLQKQEEIEGENSSALQEKSLKKEEKTNIEGSKTELDTKLEISTSSTNEPSSKDAGSKVNISGVNKPKNTSNNATEAKDNLAVEPEVKEENEVEETKSPIKQLALVAPGDEKTAKVETLTFEGSSEQSIISYTEASASQIAASSNNLGATINSKLKKEKGVAASSAPVLVAGTSGVENPKQKRLKDRGAGKGSEIKDGVTESEPNRAKLHPHQNKSDSGIRSPKINDEKKPKEKVGWVDWLSSKFGNALGSVKTNDSGVNTTVGKSPVIDTRGKANPERAKNVRNAGNSEVRAEKEKTANEIKNNSGQQNIQPKYFKEEKPVEVNPEVTATAVSKQDSNMADFLNLPLPEAVREEADKDMASSLEKSMAEEKVKAQNAAIIRDKDKQTEVKKAEDEVQKFNDQAGKDQDNTIKENRNKIAKEQDKGVKEVQAQLDSFNTEANKEQKGADKLIKARVRKDNKDADKKLIDAENEAEKKRKAEEKKAREEKAKAKRGSKKKSWWGKFKDAVSSAAKWVTDKISKVFKALKKWVGELIDKAKKAALTLIEAGRKWIVDKLDKFGKWLKSKVNKYLKHFPALRKRINKFIDDTVDGVKKIVNKIADDLKKGVEALAGALTAVLNKILDVFETILTAAVGIIGAVITGDFVAALKIAFLATCKIAGIDPNPILDFINRAGETIGKIFKDPIGFFKNVGKGVGQGINQFVTNIKKHLINGLITWLTGAMSDVPIQLPAKWDLKGIFSLVMQILGLTYRQLRAKLVKELGPKGEQVVSAMEKTVDFVIDFVKRGPIVLWEKIQNKFAEIKAMAMEKIRNVVIVEVVKAGVKWLIGLMNPASAIVKAVLMLYDLVMFFIRKKDQIVAFVTSVFDTVGPLARGEVGKAANFIEKALGKSVPVILGLLASLAGIGGIGKSVSKAINAIRGPVNKVVDPVIKWIAGIGRKMIAKGQMLIKKGKAFVKGKVEKGKEKLADAKDMIFSWWKKKRKFKTKSGEAHSLYFKGKEKSAKLMIASDPQTVSQFISSMSPVASKQDTHQKAVTIAAKIDSLQSQNPKTDKGKEKQQRDIYDQMDILAPLIANLMEGDQLPESSPPVYGGLRNGFGTSMRIDFLTKNGIKGSEPKVSSKLYDNLNLRRFSKSSNSFFYIKGHLLNHNLHGSGTTWQNLTPLSVQCNKNHSNDVEEPIKEVVLKKKEKQYGKKNYSIVRYKVEAVYGRNHSASRIKEIDKYDPDRENKIKVLEAEKHVPTKLKTFAEFLDLKTKRPIKKLVIPASIDNPIQEGSINNYAVSGQTLSYEVDLNTSNEAELTRLKGVGPVTANLLIESRKRKFKNVEDAVSRLAKKGRTIPPSDWKVKSGEETVIDLSKGD